MDRAERTGLGVAVIGHAALFVALSLSLLSPPTLPKIESDPIEVELIEEVADDTRTPEPQTAPSPPAAVEPSPASPPESIAAPDAPRPAPPEPAPRPEPRPVPRQIPKPVPAPVSRPQPKPASAPKPTPKPAAKPAPRQPAKPLSQADRRRPDKGTVVPPANRPRLANPNSGLGDAMRNLRNPAPGATPGLARPNAAPRPAAAKPGPPATDATAVKRALGSEIGRQLKPRWKAPTGADVDQLVTILSWDLAQDGSLSGAPRFISQSGVTPSNSAQAEVHRENAIKAVRAAAPFKLPPEHYAYWKSVVSFRFDKRLSQ